MKLAGFNVLFVIASIVITALVLFSKQGRRPLKDGLRASGLGVGLAVLAMIVFIANEKKFDAGHAKMFLLMRDWRYFGTARMLELGYLVLLYGVEVVIMALWQSLRSGDRPSGSK